MLKTQIFKKFFKSFFSTFSLLYFFHYNLVLLCLPPCNNHHTVVDLLLKRVEGKEEERERGRETVMYERKIRWLPLSRLQPGAWPEIQACALTRNELAIFQCVGRDPTYWATSFRAKEFHI